MSDAMPNAVLEAMASGLALIATPGGAGDLIQGNGFVVAPRDPSAIRQAVGHYLADRQPDRGPPSEVEDARVVDVLACGRRLLP